MSRVRISTLMLCLVLVGACAHRPTRVPPSSGWAPIGVVPSHWTLQGRLAVSDGKESGSGRIIWQQDGDHYTITLRAPVSGQSWRLSGDRGHSQLDGLKPQPVHGDSARDLLKRELGWELPLGEMTAWIFAAGLADEAIRARTVDGAPLQVSDSGWDVEYRDWQMQSGIALPKRITARNPPYQVRLAIQSWQPDAGATDGDDR